MSNLTNAIVLATKAHHGQVCKQKLPYILHPLRVAQRALKAWGYDENLLVAAVLHDVVEDTDVTLQQLHNDEYSAEVIEAIEYLSKRPDEEDAKTDTPEEKAEKYCRFITRVASGPILARRVKVADLWDNTDPSRINGEPTERDHRRWTKYKTALDVLLPLT